MDTKTILHKSPTQTIYSDGTSERHERDTKNWEEQYPINTFKGETKKELIDFISEIIEIEKEKWKSEMEEWAKNEGKYMTENESWCNYIDGEDLLNKLNTL